MDTKQVGENIAFYRKQRGMTQSELAAVLKVSNKTVSKWESGGGFPEVTQFPVLAKLFGVSVDRLMHGGKEGIAFVGNILTDIVKTVDCYPEIGMLSNVLSMSRAVGGCVANTAIDVASIDGSVPLYAVGRVGNDQNGEFVLSKLKKHGIDCSNVSVSKTEPTSFSDVISLPSGERTFFHMRASNAEFSPEHIDIKALNCRMLHAGYIFLLDRFDMEDEQYGTVMARFLHDVKQKGIETSIDVVSSSTGNYKEKICPALKYSDRVIINEIEACAILGLAPRTETDKPHVENIKKSMEFIASCGVTDRVIVHCKEAGFCLNVKSGEFTAVPSLKIPPEEIKGSVGAGDAFCAACLYGIYRGDSDREILEFASVCAACNLFAENSIDGMKAHDEMIKMTEKYERRKFEL